MSSIFTRTRKDGSLVYYGYFTANGKSFRKKLANDLANAKKKFAEIEYKLMFDQPLDNEKKSLDDAYTNFKQHIEMKSLSDGRTQVILNACENFIAMCYRDNIRFLHQVALETGQQYIYERSLDKVDHVYGLSEDDPKPKISPWTVNNDLQILRRFFRYCKKNGWIKHNVMLSVEYDISNWKKEQKRERFYFSDDHIQQILQIENFREFYALLLYTGLRPTDAFTLSKDEIQDGMLKLQMNKTGDFLNYIPIPQKLMELLSARITSADELIFPKMQYVYHQRKARKAIQQMFPAEMVRKENINLHTFRHTYAHKLLNSGVPKEVVQTLLGHESVETTEIYANWVKKDQLKPYIENLDFGV